MPGHEHDIVLPERLDPSSLAELRAKVEAGHTGPLLVRGANDTVFCDGLALGAHIDVDADTREQGLDDFGAIVRGIARSDTPMIAVVEGRALGGGLGIAAACDVVIASEDARFGLPEPLFGLIPGLITPIIRQRVSVPVIRRLAISGESVDARSAHVVGLVDVVVGPAKLDATARTWVRRFDRAHRPAVSRLKRWLWDLERLDDQLAQGRAHMMDLFDDPEVARRLTRFEAGLVPWEND